MSCEEKIDNSLISVLEDLRILYSNDINRICNHFDIDKNDIDEYRSNYGFCWDYVSANTFTDQPVGYYRYQLSYGGPSTEFRFFIDYEGNIDYVEYWYLNWFDGAKRTLYFQSSYRSDPPFASDQEIFQEIYNEHVGCEVAYVSV